MSVDVMVPTLGESVTEATVATWFKKAGDTVAQDEMLCELETDKVSVEVPAPASGTLSQILAEEGTTVEAGGKLAVIGGSVAAAPPAPAPPRRRRPRRRWPRRRQGRRQRAFRGKADGREGLDAASVQGTGRDGRIMKEDVLRACGSAPAACARPRSRCPRRPRARPSPPRMPSARNG
jgi:2-oxoglutarate dehydrogenase E2 component (dihydrolipoamide succinyltransferase)